MMKHKIPIPRNGVLNRCLSVIAPDLDKSTILITSPPRPSTSKLGVVDQELSPHTLMFVNILNSSIVFTLSPCKQEFFSVNIGNEPGGD